MIRFQVSPGGDPLAVRFALASCRAPLRLERSAETLSLVAADDDALRARARWLRAGLEPVPCDAWPEARPLPRGALFARNRAWRIAPFPLARVPLPANAVLLLTPVSRDDALRVIASALRSPFRLSLQRRPRPLSRVASAVASGRDGVAVARAYVVADGRTPDEAMIAFRANAGPDIRPLRGGALDAWREIGAQTGGVWRALSALEMWWSSA